MAREDRAAARDARAPEMVDVDVSASGACSRDSEVAPDAIAVGNPAAAAVFQEVGADGGFENQLGDEKRGSHPPTHAAGTLNLMTCRDAY